MDVDEEDMDVGEEEEEEEVVDLPRVTSKLADSSIHVNPNFTFMTGAELEKLRIDLQEELGLLYSEVYSRWVILLRDRVVFSGRLESMFQSLFVWRFFFDAFTSVTPLIGRSVRLSISCEKS